MGTRLPPPSSGRTRALGRDLDEFSDDEDVEEQVKRRESFRLKKLVFRRNSRQSSLRKSSGKKKKAGWNEPIFVQRSLLFNPESTFLWLWNVIVFLCVIYTVAVQPFRIAWLSTHFLPLDYTMDIIFLLDILFTFNTALKRGSGIYITSRRALAISYIKGRFFLDLLAAVPYYTFDKFGFEFSEAILRLPRLLALTRALKLSKVTDFSIAIEHMVSYFGIPQNAIRILKLLFFLSLFAHYAACLFFFIGNFFLDNEDSWLNRIWTIPLANESIGKQYLTALYWAFTTLTTVGYGDITPRTPQEITFTFVMMVLGASMFSYISGSVAAMVLESDNEKRIYEEKLNSFLEFSEAYGLSRKLENQIILEVSDDWKKPFQEYDWSTVMEDLPENYQLAIIKDLFPDLEQSVEIFKSFSGFPVFVEKLMALVEPVQYTKGEYMARSGDQCDKIFIVMTGMVHIITQNKTSLEVTQGGSIGEDAMFLWPEWEYSVRCYEKATVLTISRKKIFDLLDKHEECHQIFRQRAKLQQKEILSFQDSEEEKPTRPRSPSSKASPEIVRIRKELEHLERNITSVQKKLSTVRTGSPKSA